MTENSLKMAKDTLKSEIGLLSMSDLKLKGSFPCYKIKVGLQREIGSQLNKSHRNQISKS